MTFHGAVQFCAAPKAPIIYGPCWLWPITHCPSPVLSNWRPLDLCLCSIRLVDLLYDFLSKNRLSLGGAMDGIIAAKRMELSKQGVETCSGGLHGNLRVGDVRRAEGLARGLG